MIKITNEMIIKIKSKYNYLCFKLDDLNNNYDRYEIYDGIIEDEKPDYFKTHLKTEIKMDCYEKAFKALLKFIRVNNIKINGDY